MKSVHLTLEIELISGRCSDVLSALEPDNAGLVCGDCMDDRKIIFKMSDLKPSSIYSVVTELVASVEEAESFFSD